MPFSNLVKIVKSYSWVIKFDIFIQIFTQTVISDINITKIRGNAMYFISVLTDSYKTGYIEQEDI